MIKITCNKLKPSFPTHHFFTDVKRIRVMDRYRKDCQHQVEHHLHFLMPTHYAQNLWSLFIFSTNGHSEWSWPEMGFAWDITSSLGVSGDFFFPSVVCPVLAWMKDKWSCVVEWGAGWSQHDLSFERFIGGIAVSSFCTISQTISPISWNHFYRYGLCRSE